jgi:membrane protease YdiL (CAAX protease family)
MPHSSSDDGHATLHLGKPRGGYFALSRKPLHILVFLLPLIIFYEIGSAIWLAGSEGALAQDIRARRLLSQMFESFGDYAIYLPGILILLVLLIWHVLAKDAWRIRARAIGGMWIESLIWMIPLLILGQLLYRLLLGDAAPASWMPALLPASPDALADHSLGARATISIGAGLYEELLFRMLAIAVIHLLLVDVGGLKSSTGTIAAVVISSAMFAVYHDVGVLPGGPSSIQWPELVFFFAAGLYFGALYIVRGFGIVIGVHALYDLAVLVILPGTAN